MVVKLRRIFFDSMDRYKPSLELPAGLRPVEKGKRDIFRGKFFQATTDQLVQMETALLRVGTTETIGSGLFAKIDIPKDARLFCVQGDEYQCYEDQEEYTANLGERFPSLAPGALLPNAICVDQQIEPESQRRVNVWLNPREDSPLRFLNHSCNPNTGRLGPYVFVAMKKIQSGEQIAADYSMLEVNSKWSMQCDCGSADCRHRISSVESLPLEVAERYWPYLPTFIRRIYLRGVGETKRSTAETAIVKKLRSDITDGFF